MAQLLKKWKEEGRGANPVVHTTAEDNVYNGAFRDGAPPPLPMREEDDDIPPPPLPRDYYDD